MSTTLTPSGAGLPERLGDALRKARAVVDRDSERTYVRFFVAAICGLVLGGIQGVVQRLPGISDWLTNAGYGGHLITHLAQTHVIMVGAGTLTVTAMMYYLLPRILNRPLYSKTLTNVSFVLTVLGVYGFYFVMIFEGLVLGTAVTRGIDYDTARIALGAWYDVPTGIAGGLMGIGYWLFVANIYLTMRHPRGWKGPESYIAKYIFLGTTGLFLGTIQGFYQILPWSVNFIRATGLAGEEIDPVAHAHINMVCGMAMTLMGMTYYILPRLLGKPIWNLPLARWSFWFAAVGVLGFWIGLITLGLVEGNMMLGIMQHASVSVDQAYNMAVARVGIWHNLVRAGFGTLMGLGFWSYILIVVQTFRSQPSARAFPARLVAGDVAVPPPDADTRFNALFFLASSVALLIGTIQGVIQIFPGPAAWLDSAGLAGNLITPLAHAQMNIVASIGLGLMGMVYFALPKFAGKPWASQPLIRFSFITTVVGISLYYVSLLALGFIEIPRVLALVNGPQHLSQTQAFLDARNAVGWAHPFWLVLSNSILAVGYLTYAVNVVATLGAESWRAGVETNVLQAARFLDRALAVGKSRQAHNQTELRWGTARAFVIEFFAGCLGFCGAGWFVTGRSGFGLGLFFTWVASWIIFVEWVLATQSQIYGPDFSFVVPALPLYFGLLLTSASCAALTYHRRGLRRPKPKATRRPAPRVVESNARLIAEPQAGAVEVID